jgi:hypothetical protein
MGILESIGSLVSSLAVLACAAAPAAGPPPQVQTPPPSSAPASEEPPEAAPSPFPPLIPPPDMLDTKSYDAAVLAASKSPAGKLGPFDGGWRLQSEGGEGLYSFQISDTPPDPREGAWRDLDPSAAAPRSGFLSSIAYDGARLMLRFDETGPKDLVVVTLKAQAEQWSGKLWRRGKERRVTLKRP